MDFLQILILSLVQALTEFLPVSSSAHLVLASEMFGLDANDFAAEVVVEFKMGLYRNNKQKIKKGGNRYATRRWNGSVGVGKQIRQRARELSTCRDGKLFVFYE